MVYSFFGICETVSSSLSDTRNGIRVGRVKRRMRLGVKLWKDDLTPLYRGRVDSPEPGENGSETSPHSDYK